MRLLKMAYFTCSFQHSPKNNTTHNTHFEIFTLANRWIDPIRKVKDQQRSIHPPFHFTLSLCRFFHPSVSSFSLPHRSYLVNLCLYQDANVNKQGKRIEMSSVRIINIKMNFSISMGLLLLSLLLFFVSIPFVKSTIVCGSVYACVFCVCFYCHLH